MEGFLSHQTIEVDDKFPSDYITFFLFYVRSFLDFELGSMADPILTGKSCNVGDHYQYHYKIKYLIGLVSGKFQASKKCCSCQVYQKSASAFTIDVSMLQSAIADFFEICAPQVRNYSRKKFNKLMSTTFNPTV